VGLPPFGTDAFLRTRLRAHLKQIKQDDYQIEKEGLEDLTEEELRLVWITRHTSYIMKPHRCIFINIHQFKYFLYVMIAWPSLGRITQHCISLIPSPSSLAYTL
jgi:hypothetical protein